MPSPSENRGVYPGFFPGPELEGLGSEGLEQFTCIQCHACCRQPGYVRLKSKEPDAIAEFLQMDVRRFIHTFTRLTHDRTGLSLIEQDNGACVFLTEHGCRIQPVKPEQCRNFQLFKRFLICRIRQGLT